MSEAGEVGEMYEDSDFDQQHQQQRTSSFSAFASPPPPRTGASLLTFQQQQQQEEDEQTRRRRLTVATSQSGSVYPEEEYDDDEEREARESTYSLNDSYFALDPEDSRRESRRLSGKGTTPSAREEASEASKGEFWVVVSSFLLSSSTRFDP